MGHLGVLQACGVNLSRHSLSFVRSAFRVRPSPSDHAMIRFNMVIDLICNSRHAAVELIEYVLATLAHARAPCCIVCIHQSRECEMT